MTITIVLWSLLKLLNTDTQKKQNLMYSRLELRNLDKQRIMELAQELASVPDNDTGYAKHYILEDIENELDAKPVMPKVFDDFAKHFNLKEQQGDGALDDALTQLFDMYMYGGNQYDELETYMRMVTKYDDAFYADCVNACVYGYEVDDNE